MWWEFGHYGWLVALVIIFGFVLTIRYLNSRERIALVRKGYSPEEVREMAGRQSSPAKRASEGLVPMAVGAALLVALYPVGIVDQTGYPFGIGPWLLFGLIPFLVGAALFLTRNSEEARELRGGLIPMVVGLALLIGLYPIGLVQETAYPFGIGPWLIGGLIPLLVGVVILISKVFEAQERRAGIV